MKLDDFRDQANCRLVGHQLFFGPAADEERETPAAKEKREAKARALCASCPVISKCETYANGFRDGLQAGIWHGGDHTERRKTRIQSLRRARANRAAS